MTERPFVEVETSLPEVWNRERRGSIPPSFGRNNAELPAFLAVVAPVV
jgi:hypothetical protein